MGQARTDGYRRGCIVVFPGARGLYRRTDGRWRASGKLALKRRLVAASINSGSLPELRHQAATGKKLPVMTL
jgi:hypothetical protein